MAIKPVSGEVKSQDINDNLGYLDSKIEQVSGGPLGVLTSETELKQKYPNGANGFFLISNNMWFWEGGKWVNKGAYPVQGLAKNSVTKDKLAFRFMTGIIKQGSMNADTVNKKITFTANAGVYVENLQSYFSYTTQPSIDYSGSTRVFSIYFNIVSKTFVVYETNETMLNPENLVLIENFWIGDSVFSGIQPTNVLFIDGVNMTNTNKSIAYPINGSFKIDTINKKIDYAASNILSADGFNMVLQSKELSVDLDFNRAINFYFDFQTKELKPINFQSVDSNNKDLKYWCTLFNKKVYGASEKSLISVNGVKDGGWENNQPEEKVEKLTLNDFYLNWLSGSKYPLVFLSDSTTDGVGTSETVRNVVGTDYINKYAYPYLLESRLKSNTNNSNLRIYNAGFSGKTAKWAYENIEAIITNNQAYKDCKGLVIGYGINDSLVNNVAAIISQFSEYTEKLIEWCMSKKIQPFLMTTQTVIAKDRATLTNSRDINLITNTVKIALSKKYDIELIDINQATNDFLTYSDINLAEIIVDNLHFGNKGHIFEADYIYTQFDPAVLKTSKTKKIGVVNQNVIVKNPQYLVKTTDDTKMILDVDRSVETRIELATVEIYNDSNQSINVNVDGTGVSLLINDQSINTLQIGLNKIVIETSAKKATFKTIVLE